MKLEKFKLTEPAEKEYEKFILWDQTEGGSIENAVFLNISATTKKEIIKNYPQPDWTVSKNGDDTLLIIKNKK